MKTLSFSFLTMIILHKNEVRISTKFVEAVGITMPSYTLSKEHSEGPGGICPENFESLPCTLL